MSKKCVPKSKWNKKYARSKNVPNGTKNVRKQEICKKQKAKGTKNVLVEQKNVTELMYKLE